MEKSLISRILEMDPAARNRVNVHLELSWITCDVLLSY